MKKIISAVALASLLVGFASADVKFELNYRTRMVAFSRLINAPDDNDYENMNYWFKQSNGWNDASDKVSLAAANDFGGVNLVLEPNAATNEIKVNEYSAYVKLGSLEVGSGAWKDGKYLEQYQIAEDADAGWYEDDLFGVAKLGSIYTGAITAAVDNIVDFADSESGALSGYVTWNGKVGAADLTATGALIGFGDGTTTWDEEKTIYSGIGLQLNAKTDRFEGEFVFKSASNDTTSGFSAGGEQRAFGLYVMPVLKDSSSKLTVGGALGYKDGNLTEISGDFRYRKDLGKTSITFYTNLSHLTNKCNYTVGVAHVGAEYLAGDAATFAENALKGNERSTDKGLSGNFNTHMWNMLAVRSAIKDNLFFLFSAGDVISLRAFGESQWSGAELFVAPGIQLTNGNCGLATYLRVGMSHIGVKDYDKDGSEQELAVMVPVVFRVSL